MAAKNYRNNKTVRNENRKVVNSAPEEILYLRRVNPDLTIRKQKAHAALKPLADNVEVFVRDRSKPVEKVELFIGPTNSGKTYHALQQLFDDYEKNRSEVHVYSAPLRLLAYEVYKKMCDRYGEESVGFITGEENINPDAKLLATTVEMAPESGHALLIDEAHWLIDDHRGHIWSRLLIGAKYTNMYVVTAAEGVPMVKNLVSDAWDIQEHTYSRKTGVRWGGQMPMHKIKPKTAIVCFSRRAVYAIAHEARKSGLKVGVLYGALPLAVRKQQLDAYERGDIDVMVTTDVIGHGINLPIDNLVFAETTKYDGRERRSLKLWEAAQIAGRAGRFGLSEDGAVFAATGESWIHPDYGIIKNAIKAAAGQKQTDLELHSASLFPRFGDLGLDPEGGTEEAVKLTYVLEIWKRRVNQKLKGRNLVPSQMSIVMNNLKTVLGFLGAPEKLWNDDFELHSAVELKGYLDVNVLDVWRVITGAFDPKGGVVEAALYWLSDKGTVDSSIRMQEAFEELVKKPVDSDESSLTELEAASVRLGEFKMLNVIFDGLGAFDVSEIGEYENKSNSRIESLLQRPVSQHQCKECGNSAPLQFDICDSCYKNRNQSQKYRTLRPTTDYRRRQQGRSQQSKKPRR